MPEPLQHRLAILMVHHIIQSKLAQGCLIRKRSPGTVHWTGENTSSVQVALDTQHPNIPPVLEE